MEKVLHDLRYGVRILLKNYGFTTVAVTTLALGIGANCAIFTVINSVLLKPLAYEEADRLVSVQGANPSRGFKQTPFSPLGYIEYRDRNQVFENLSGFWPENFNITEGDKPELVQGSMVTANFFSVMRSRMALGRAFLPEEEKSGGSRLAVIGHRLWQSHFGSNPSIVGQTLRINGSSFIVIGVTASEFQSPVVREELWIPLALDGSDALRRPSALNGEEMKNRKRRFLSFIGRLKPGVTLQQAQADMTAIAQGLERQFPDADEGWTVMLTSLHEQVVGNIRTTLLVLLGAVGFVLLIVCANVANLLIARAMARTKEIATRIALGASRARLIQQLLTESLLLALLGGVPGLLFAALGVRLLINVSPESIPRAEEIKVDLKVLGVTLAISLLTGLLFGLIPAWQSTKPNLNESLKEGGRDPGGGFSRRIRSMLVISEVSLTLVLLISAGLMIKSFYRLQEVRPGFSPENLLTMRVVLPPSKYAEGHQKAAFYQQALQRIGTVPGVASAGASTIIPLNGESTIFRFTIEGRPPSYPSEVLTANYRAISPSYFRTMRIPFLRGRDFTDQDTEDSPGAVIISESMMRRYWPDEDPTGKHIIVNFGKPISREIVGVVGDVKHSALEAESSAEMYVPHLQTPWAAMYLVVHTASDPNTFVPIIRKEILAVDKDQSVAGVKTMEQIISESVSQRRLSMILLILFAGLALVLAAVGIYGVMAFSVSQRRHEIGIRLALGAQQFDVIKLIVRQAMAMALAGVTVGLAAAFLLTRILASLLYGVGATDTITFVAVPLIMGSVAFLASYIPAREATKVDPIMALRYE